MRALKITYAAFLACALSGGRLTAQIASQPAQNGSVKQTAGAARATGQSAATGQNAAGQNATGGQAPTAAEPTAAAGAAPPATQNEVNEPRSSDRRRAAKEYLAASKLFLNSQFEEAMQGFERAASLDPSNNSYRLAADVARSHEVTALIQAAAKEKLTGDEAAARADLARALELDPKNFEASQHLDELADDAVRSETKPLYEGRSGRLADAISFLPSPARHSFHTHGFARQIVEQVFQAYGIKAMVDDSVTTVAVRVDLDDVSFDEAARIVGMLTKTFYVALDTSHAVVARDTRQNRERYMRLDVETIYLAGLSDEELTEVENLAKNVFDLQQAKASMAERTITLRAPASTLNAFNSTIRTLLDGKSQVLLEMRIIQVAHTSNRNTGVQFPQTINAFNVFAEEQSLLSQNQALVQQIISSGLASPNDPLAILGILLASGQVSSSLLGNGFAVFGGGLTQSALSPGPITIKLNLNTSDSRELDQIQLRLQDGEPGTLKEGSRYPIQTSSFSSVSPNLSSIPGLSGAGTSSSLSSLLSSLSSTVPNIPMVQYQDIGLTLMATPKVMRNDDVALSIDMKLNALAGTSIDGNPVLNNRAYNGTITLREGEAAVVATEVDKSQSQAISGTPGISEIPGLNDVTSKDAQNDYATIVIVMTPHVIRGTQAAGHTAMMRIEKSGAAQ
jgi:Flp pilus assembly secretin CpaC